MTINVNHNGNGDGTFCCGNGNREDGKEETFEVIGVFEVEEKEYIALQSQEDGSILLCKYIEKEDGEYEVEEIEDDEEFSKVSDAFDALVEEDEE